MKLTFEDVRFLVGGELVDADESKVGKIEDIYLDNDTQEPAWALVHTGLLPTARPRSRRRPASIPTSK
jgi:hypothetical protein